MVKRKERGLKREKRGLGVGEKNSKNVWHVLISVIKFSLLCSDAWVLHEHPRQSIFGLLANVLWCLKGFFHLVCISLVYVDDKSNSGGADTSKITLMSHMECWKIQSTLFKWVECNLKVWGSNVPNASHILSTDSSIPPIFISSKYNFGSCRSSKTALQYHSYKWKCWEGGGATACLTQQVRRAVDSDGKATVGTQDGNRSYLYHLHPGRHQPSVRFAGQSPREPHSLPLSFIWGRGAEVMSTQSNCQRLNLRWGSRYELEISGPWGKIRFTHAIESMLKCWELKWLLSRM